MEFMPTKLIALSVIGFVWILGCNAEEEPPSTDLRIIAKVTEYERAASWDHFDDGSFATHDCVAFQLLEPAELSGKILKVYLSELPDESLFCIPGTKVTFEIDRESLDKDPLFWGALTDPAVYVAE